MACSSLGCNSRRGLVAIAVVINVAGTLGGTGLRGTAQRDRVLRGRSARLWLASRCLRGLAQLGCATGVSATGWTDHTKLDRLVKRKL